MINISTYMAGSFIPVPFTFTSTRGRSNIYTDKIRHIKFNIISAFKHALIFPLERAEGISGF